MRKAGILLPITSLPSKYGIGCFSQEAYELIDWLKKAGQSYWQILPIGQTGFLDSPYQSFSSFAINPYFIDLESLIDEGILEKEEVECLSFGEHSVQIDYEKIYHSKTKALKIAYDRSDFENELDYKEFYREHSYWLEDYSLYMAFKEHYHNASFDTWDKEIKEKQEGAVKKLAEKLKNEVNFWRFVQYKAYSQWKRLRKYAKKQGIKIIGDIPIYASYDSSDVWANQDLFDLDNERKPRLVAGCPPDAFSKDGQLWGNPLYKWENHKKSGYLWWYNRINHALSLFDVLRIDHFRGFDEFYSIEYKEKTAKNGKWQKGPGYELFEKIIKEYGAERIIAEDLGFITESVRELLDKTSFAGMRIFQFGFDARDTSEKGEHRPHNYPINSVAYTGTHDNPTIISWFFEITKEERELVRCYLGDYFSPDSEINFSIISSVMQSQSRLVIIPIQDYLGLDSRARINTPSTKSGNWTWRLKKDELTTLLSEKIYKITKAQERI